MLGNKGSSLNGKGIQSPFPDTRLCEYRRDECLVNRLIAIARIGSAFLT